MMQAQTAQPPPGRPPNSNLDALIHAEQIDMLYRQSPTSIIGNMTGALVLAGVFSSERPFWLIAGWVACMTALQVSRLVLYARYRKNGLVQRNLGRTTVIWTTGAGVTGVLWGSTALLFFISGDHVYQAVLTVLIFGITASAIPLIGSYIPSFYAFVFPALLPFIARNAFEGSTPHLVLGLIEAAVMVGFALFAHNYNRMLIESLRNRFEKQELADRLAAQNVDLKQARVVAEQANRSKTQFFAAASHDLRQPLHAMGLFASALADKVHDPEVAKLVASINGSVQALEALFNELLDISKLDSAVIKPCPQSFAVNEVFNQLRSEFATEAAAKGLGFTIETSPALAYSDPVLVERVLRNLVANAVRYTETGAVTVAATKHDSSLRIEVRDTGIGIREEDQQRIFDEFLQLGNPGRTSKKGLGLGLSIVQRLCDLLGSRIRVESAVGKGSTFGFDIPLSTAQPEAPAATSSAADGGANLAGRLVVAIDDEEAIIAGMQALLEGWGAQVIGSTTGKDVTEKVHAAGKLPDLFIIDYRLGAGDTGIELAQRLRQELDPEIPAILVTGSITPELAEAARAAGLEFMLKPVTAAALRERIAAALKLDVISRR
jgi:signal transduction histidine kinase